MGQTYPARVVKVLVGFPPGGGSDVVARMMSERLGERFRQPFVVENRLGANGVIAMQAVISSPSDGYTLMVTTSGSLTVSPLLQKNMPHDLVTSFTPVALAVAFPFILFARSDFPASDVKGLVQYARDNPGKLSYGSPGIGSSNHLGGEWFKSLNKIDMTHVPYKGDAAAMADIIAGRLDIAFGPAILALPQVKSGKIKSLASTSSIRTRFAQGIPTMIESGAPEFIIEPWNGLVGPAGLPRDIVLRLNQAVNEELGRDDIQARLTEMNLYSITDTPEGFRRRLEQQLAHWSGVIKQAKIQAVE